MRQGRQVGDRGRGKTTIKAFRQGGTDRAPALHGDIEEAQLPQKESIDRAKLIDLARSEKCETTANVSVSKKLRCTEDRDWVDRREREKILKRKPNYQANGVSRCSRQKKKALFLHSRGGTFSTGHVKWGTQPFREKREGGQQRRIRRSDKMNKKSGGSNGKRPSRVPSNMKN